MTLRSSWVNEMMFEKNNYLCLCPNVHFYMLIWKEWLIWKTIGRSIKYLCCLVNNIKKINPIINKINAIVNKLGLMVAHGGKVKWPLKRKKVPHPCLNVKKNVIRELKYQSSCFHPPRHQETAFAWTCSWYGEHLIHISDPFLLDAAKEQALRQGLSLHWQRCWGGQWPSWGLPVPPGRRCGEVRDSAGLSFRFPHCWHQRSHCPLGLTKAQSSSCLGNQMPPDETQVSRDEDGSILELFYVHLLNHTQRGGQISCLHLWWTVFNDINQLQVTAKMSHLKPKPCLMCNQKIHCIPFPTWMCFKTSCYLIV